MKNIIRELMYGNIGDLERIKQPQDEDFKKLTDKEYKMYDDLRESIAPDIFKKMEDFLDCVIERRGDISLHYYAAGFKVGLMLGVECSNLSDDWNK